MAGSAAVRHARQPQQAGLFESREPLAVELVDSAALLGDDLPLLELAVEKRACDLTEDVGRTDIDPGVFVDFAPEEGFSIGPLVANDLGTGFVLGPVHAQSASFTARVVLRFMEAQRTEMADRPERLVLVPRQHCLSGVFDHDQPILLGDLHDAGHVAGDSRVVRGDDDLRAVRNRPLDEILIDV